MTTNAPRHRPENTQRPDPPPSPPVVGKIELGIKLDDGFMPERGPITCQHCRQIERIAEMQEQNYLQILGYIAECPNGEDYIREASELGMERLDEIRQENKDLKNTLKDAEETMDLMRAECEMVPGRGHDDIACTESWCRINDLWSEYQRKHKLGE